MKHQNARSLPPTTAKSINVRRTILVTESVVALNYIMQCVLIGALLIETDDRVNQITVDKITSICV